MSILETIISITCAVASLVAAIIIAVVQYKQGKRMESLALRQDKEEKKRREQQIKVQRDSFIMKYYNDNSEIYLLPLCWIASVYNSALSYHRKMYMEYNMLEEDIQKAICDYMHFNVQTSIYGEDFYKACVKKLVEKEEEYTTQQPSLHIFYDNAKYLEYCIEHYKHEPLRDDINSLEREVIELIHEFLDNNECNNPIQKFAFSNGFFGSNEKKSCLICAIAAKGISEHNSDFFKENEYWIPGGYGGEQLETFEDLFLCTLFCIYVNLILSEIKGD